MTKRLSIIWFYLSLHSIVFAQVDTDIFMQRKRMLILQEVECIDSLFQETCLNYILNSSSCLENNNYYLVDIFKSDISNAYFLTINTFDTESLFCPDLQYFYKYKGRTFVIGNNYPKWIFSPLQNYEKMLISTPPPAPGGECWIILYALQDYYAIISNTCAE